MLSRDPLPRIAKTSLVDEVITVIRKMLHEDAWSPGARLPSEQELARQLGVGRSTVREALRVLGHLGVVEPKAGLGTFVVDRGMKLGQEHPQSPEVLKELYEFRRAIEVPAARLAAQRRTSGQLKAITTAWHSCGLAVKRDSAEEFARLDFRFHLSIIKASGNRFYLQAYEGLEGAFRKNVNLILALGPLRSMLHFHDNLIRAIKRSDPDAAARAVNENFVETDVRLRLLLENNADPKKK